jgi:putative membrane protein
MHLSADERARIHAATRAAEARTHARFAVSTLHVSDRYALYPVIYGAVAGMIILGALAIFWPNANLRIAFTVAASGFVMLSLLFEWLPLRLMLVPRHIKHHHAHDLAHREFAAHILAPSERKPGIVFFVSLGERYVEIIANRDVHQLVAQPAWDAIIAEFTDAARQGRVADGLVAAVDRCAKLLETHYPAK